MNAPAERGVLGRPGAPAAARARFLLPGEWWFGSDVVVSTLLGSCVAVTLWHPRRLVGGMCHYLLPCRQRAFDQPLDGRYGDEAIERLEQSMKRVATLPHEYAVHLIGGANMFPDQPNATIDIGARNAVHGRELLQRRGFAEPVVDVGGTRHRRVEFEIATGRVAVRTGS